MIGSLRGKIIFKAGNRVEVDAGGVGWEVFLSPADLNEINLGEEAEIFTYHHVAEDKNDLYGFLKREDKTVFEMLLSVSGVGPKTALAVFTAGNGARIIKAIAGAEVDFFRAVKGLGEKAAQRIIVDLRNKVGAVGDLDLTKKENSAVVFQALSGLGFTGEEIRAVLPLLPPEATTEDEKIKAALKLLGKIGKK